LPKEEIHLGFGDAAISSRFAGDSICAFGYQEYFFGIGVIGMSPESLVDEWYD